MTDRSPDAPTIVQTTASTTADARPADLVWGAFSDDAPWVLRQDGIRWAAHAERLRAEARREVPELTRASKWPHGARVVRVTARLTRAMV
ncbi:MAG: hypothetical protein AB7V43_21495, partial [Acidimicrobiia bacterium]